MTLPSNFLIKDVEMVEYEEPTSTKGELAKTHLLQTALDVFGEYGFDAATTRMIARRAGVNIAAIAYYFGGKRELYHAVVHHVAGFLAFQLDPVLDEIDQYTANKQFLPHRAMDLLEKLLGKMCDFIVGSPEAARFARIILREQLIPSSAYEMIFERVMAPFLEAGSQLIAVISEIPAGRRTSMQALALFGQIMAFRVARETMVRALAMKGYSPEETEEIRRIVLAQTRAALTSRE